jgi:AraC-like DNA-binding protein
MQEIFDLRNGDSFPLSPGLPEDYGGTLLQGSFSNYGRTPAGIIILQNFHRTGFAIQLGIFKFLHLVHCFLKPPVFPLVSIHSLKNDLKSRIPGVGSFTLRENEFSFIHYGEEVVLADFKTSREYQLLEISYSAEMIAQTIPYFPNLSEQFETSVKLPSATLITHQHKMSVEAQRIITDLLVSPYDIDVNETYIEEKIREYIWQLMVESSKMDEPNVLLSKDEKNRLRELGDRMDRHPQGKFPISRLSRDLHMNEMTFKMAFKQIFGKGVFEYHLDQRMKESYRLLKNEGLPIKMVAGMVGYELTTSFITKFIEYFGYPPSQIQKKL